MAPVRFESLRLTLVSVDRKKSASLRSCSLRSQLRSETRRHANSPQVSPLVACGRIELIFGESLQSRLFEARTGNLRHP